MRKSFLIHSTYHKIVIGVILSQSLYLFIEDLRATATHIKFKSLLF